MLLTAAAGCDLGDEVVHRNLLRALILDDFWPRKQKRGVNHSTRMPQSCSRSAPPRATATPDGKAYPCSTP
jgi:hypothetical protein